MSSSSVSLKSSLVLHSDRLTSSGALVIPTRLAGADLERLSTLAPGRTIALLLDASAAYTAEQQAAIDLHPTNQLTLQEAGTAEQVRQAVAKGTLVVFVPGPVVAQAATSITISRVTLQWLADLDVAAQPVFIDHPRESKLRQEPASRHKEAIMVFCNLLPAESVTVPQLWETLLVAGAEALAR